MSELPSTVLRIDAGEPQPSAKRLCLFASFDPNSRLQPTTLAYLAALQEAGCATVFVTTSPTLAEADRVKLSQYCSWIVHRENRGYDFYSWKLALEFALRNGMDQLPILLTNDSVLGPLTPLDAVFAPIDAEPELVWGLTDSRETGEWHLQSYFLHIPASQIASRWFQDFWATLAIKGDKDDIIRSYELGFSQAARQAKLPCRAIFDSKSVIAAAKTRALDFQYHQAPDLDSLNVTLFMWDLLIEEFGFPFIKAELLRHDRFASRAILHWPQILPKSTPSRVRHALLEFEESCMWQAPRANAAIEEHKHARLGFLRSCMRSLRHWHDTWDRWLARLHYARSLQAIAGGDLDMNVPGFHRRRDLLFLGAFDDLASGSGAELAWFMREVMPQLRQSDLEDVELHAVGALSGSVQHRLSRCSLRNFKLLTIEQQLAQLFDRYKAVVVPAQAIGDHLHIARAAAKRGVPTLCTPQLAAALGWQSGRHCLVAKIDKPNEFADTCRSLIVDEKLWQVVRDGAWRAVGTAQAQGIVLNNDTTCS